MGYVQYLKVVEAVELLWWEELMHLLYVEEVRGVKFPALKKKGVTSSALAVDRGKVSR